MVRDRALWMNIIAFLAIIEFNITISLAWYNMYNQYLTQNQQSVTNGPDRS